MTSALVRHRIAAAQAQGYRCIYCRLPMWDCDQQAFAHRYGLSLRQAMLQRCTAEHLRARRDGGRDGQLNIAAACAHCNNMRHRARLPLSPEAFGARVRRRLGKGAWLPREVLGKLNGQGRG